MKIVVNGDSVDVAAGLSISELLKVRQVKLPDMVSVELNDTILERPEFEATKLAEGDRVELLYFMGGGSR